MCEAYLKGELLMQLLRLQRSWMNTENFVEAFHVTSLQKTTDHLKGIVAI